MVMETESIYENFYLKEPKRMENVQDSNYVNWKTSWIDIFYITSEY
jgi:hypothetical protein